MHILPLYTSSQNEPIRYSFFIVIRAVRSIGGNSFSLGVNLNRALILYYKAFIDIDFLVFKGNCSSM